MASTSDIKKGLCFEYNNDVYKVVDFQHVKPGKGAAFVSVKMKSVTKGSVLENNFPSGHTITIVRTERRDCQFQYKNTDDDYIFMNTETYDDVIIPEKMIDNADLMTDGLMVNVLFAEKDSTILSVELPASITLEITYTEPGLKGDTATNTLKAATVETGAEIKVPLFVATGDRVRVNSETREYMDRVKS